MDEEAQLLYSLPPLPLSTPLRAVALVGAFAGSAGRSTLRGLAARPAPSALDALRRGRRSRRARAWSARGPGGQRPPLWVNEPGWRHRSELKVIAGDAADGPRGKGGHWPHKEMEYKGRHLSLSHSSSLATESREKSSSAKQPSNKRRRGCLPPRAAPKPPPKICWAPENLSPFFGNRDVARGGGLCDDPSMRETVEARQFCLMLAAWPLPTTPASISPNPHVG